MIWLRLNSDARYVVSHMLATCVEQKVVFTKTFIHPNHSFTLSMKSRGVSASIVLVAPGTGVPDSEREINVFEKCVLLVALRALSYSVSQKLPIQVQLLFTPFH